MMTRTVPEPQQLMLEGQHSTAYAGAAADYAGAASAYTVAPKIRPTQPS